MGMRSRGYKSGGWAEDERKMSGRSENLSGHISEKCIVLIVQQHTAGIEDKGEDMDSGDKIAPSSKVYRKNCQNHQIPTNPAIWTPLTLLHSKHPITPL